MVVRYPAGPITPHGAYYLRRGDHPEVKLTAPDGSIVFHLMGGRAIPDRTKPEVVQVKRGGIKGLIAPWQAIKQKGATQDGTTFIDAFYDEGEPELTVVCRGRPGKHIRRVVRDLIGSLDAIQTSELSWWTQELGKWWADIRWGKVPVDPAMGAQTKRQQLSLRLSAVDAFWRSLDHTDQFGFLYESDIDTFNYTTDMGDLGAGWDIALTGAGGGGPRANGSQCVWVDDPDDPILTDGRTAVMRRVGFITDTDNQVIETVLGSLSEFSFPDNAYDELWGRMPTSGTPGDDGIRLRIGVGSMRLSYFVAGFETILRDYGLLDWQVWIPPLPGEKFSLVCGYEGDPRMFAVMRNGVQIIKIKEQGVDSQLGSGFRGAGFGMHAGGSLITQATPAALRKWNAGDNVTVSQTGYLKRINMGDQPMPDRYICFGPGTFRFPAALGSTDMVEFGPLLPNQVMRIDTDPQKRGVVDLTSVPPSPQELDDFQQAIKDFISFATGNNVPPLFQQLESVFGIAPPQGNPYSLLKGRFSDDAAIPPKSPGDPAQPYYVQVQIVGGNADSKVIAAGTPLRRYPI